MKSLGTEPSSRSSRTFSWLTFGAAVTFCGALIVSACIPPGNCDDCEDAPAGGSGGGGKGGGGTSAGPPAELEVEGCEAYTTIAEVEKEIIVKSCAAGSPACHAGMTQTDMKAPGIALRLLNKAPKLAPCKADKLIAPGAPEDSLFLRKLEPMPTCSNGDEGGLPMPSSGVITDAQKSCLQGYVRALAAWAATQ